MFDETLAKIGSSLDRCGIPYMIIGGQAVLLYGEPRLTRDVDITLGVGEMWGGLAARCPQARRDRKVSPEHTFCHSGLDPESMRLGA